MSAEKLKIYNEWASRMHAAGMELAEYECPRCKFLMHAHIPSQEEKVSDTFAHCPNCGELHWRCVKSDGSAFATIPTEHSREVSHAEAE